MSHDPSKVILGSTLSSVREIGNRKGEIEAGVAVRQKSDGTISTALVDGGLIGISVGRDLSDAGFTSIAYRGEQVPVRLATGFTPVVGSVVFLDNATGFAKASATDATAVNAVYSRSAGPVLKSGIPEGGGSEVAVALIDFPGGL